MRPLGFPGFILSTFDHLSEPKQDFFPIAIGKGLMPSNAYGGIQGQDLIGLVMPVQAR